MLAHDATSVSHNQQFGMQPPPNAVAKAIGFARSLTSTTFLFGIVVVVAQATMPEGGRPSDLIGAFHGSTNTAQLDAERIAQVATTQALANVQAEQAAKWEMEKQAAMMQLQLTAGTLGTQASIADLSDLSCFAANAVTALVGQEAEGLAGVLRMGCGTGDQIRDSMNSTLARTLRDNSSVAQRSAPPRVSPAPPSLVSQRPAPVAAAPVPVPPVAAVPVPAQPIATDPVVSPSPNQKPRQLWTAEEFRAERRRTLEQLTP